MSGGAFGYLEWKLKEASNQIRRWAEDKEKKGTDLKPETIKMAREVAEVLDIAGDYEYAFDYLISCDIGEDDFLKYLEKPSARLRNIK